MQVEDRGGDDMTLAERQATDSEMRKEEMQRLG